MGIFNPQTFLGEMLDKAADLDRASGRNPQQRDSALAMACETYTAAHYEYNVERTQRPRLRRSPAG
jgi:hypothetical protein